jgi:hypothetical protein
MCDTGFAPAESKKALAQVETAASEVQGAAYYNYNKLELCIVCLIFFTFLLYTSFVLLKFCYILHSLDVEHLTTDNIPTVQYKWSMHQ